MRHVTRPTRVAVTAAATFTLGLGLTACQNEVTSGSSGSGSSATASVSSAAAPSTAASPSTSAQSSEAPASSSSPAASPTSSSGAATSGADATATGTQSKVTFTLPQGFKVFDRQELQNDTDLAELSKITGASAASLRPTSSDLDLSAVSLAKEDGATSNILLYGSKKAIRVPTEAEAKKLIAETGSTYRQFGTAKTSLGQAALIESTDPAAGGGTITHVDIFLPTHDGATGQLTITTRTAKRAHELAEQVASTVKAAS